jgi:hypothetical protein
MPIVNSVYIVDATPQADGRRWVKENHKVSNRQNPCDTCAYENVTCKMCRWNPERTK